LRLKNLGLTVAHGPHSKSIFESLSYNTATYSSQALATEHTHPEMQN